MTTDELQRETTSLGERLAARLHKAGTGPRVARKEPNAIVLDAPHLSEKEIRAEVLNPAGEPYSYLVRVVEIDRGDGEDLGAGDDLPGFNYVSQLGSFLKNRDAARESTVAAVTGLLSERYGEEGGAQ